MFVYVSFFLIFFFSFVFLLMIRRPPRSTLDRSSAASDVYKRQHQQLAFEEMQKRVLEAQARVGRLEAALGEAVDAWRFAPLVRNLQVLSLIHISEPTRPS